MPQLFPMNWLFLSILLTLTVYFVLNLVYFLPFKNPSSKNFNKQYLYKNWKW
uniref:ATP synthase subunit 8 n=1 Tax=Argas miniatus TaxID=1442166 RepID=W0FHW3_ARGMI|nr:ATP synthase F0 subunit 8 [Argas miniatus]AHF21642.1 ATP synthase subunit 8 [Argas miniatus]